MRCALGPVIVMLGELHAAIVEPGVIAEVRRTAERACDQSFMRFPQRSRLLIGRALGLMPVTVLLGELHAAIVEPGVIAGVRRTAEWAWGIDRWSRHAQAPC